MNIINFAFGMLIFCETGEYFYRHVNVARSSSSNGTLQCGERYLKAEDDFKYLVHPGYLVNYEHDMDCTWTMQADSFPDHVVYVEVVNSSLGQKHPSGACTYDSVTAYDGPNTEHWEIITWCGQDTPEIRSTRDYLTIHFHTDDRSSVDVGFRLKYQQIPDTCGGYLSATSNLQYFTSPGHNELFQKDLDCKWVVTARTGSNIHLAVSTTSMDSRSCGDTHSVASVYDGGSVDAPQLGKFCGAELPCFISSGGSILVRYRMYDTGLARVFRMSYQSGNFKACEHKELFSSLYPQEIKSPCFPYQYPQDEDCTWTINTGDSDYVVHIEITTPEENMKDCSTAYLHAFDDRIGERTLKIWCGSRSSSSETATSLGQYMFIKFHFKFDKSFKMAGFKVQYSSKLRSSVLIVGGTIGGILACIGLLAVAFIGFAIYRAIKRRRNQRQVQHLRTRQDSAHRHSRHTVHATCDLPSQSPVSCPPPPSYDEVLAQDQAEQAADPPPPYSSLAVVSGTLSNNDVTGARKNSGIRAVDVTFNQ